MTRKIRNTPPESSESTDAETSTTVVPDAPDASSRIVQHLPNGVTIERSPEPGRVTFEVTEQNREPGVAGVSVHEHLWTTERVEPTRIVRCLRCGKRGDPGEPSPAEMARRMDLARSAIASDPTLGGLLSDPIRLAEDRAAATGADAETVEDRLNANLDRLADAVRDLRKPRPEPSIADRLESLRAAIEAESISYGEIAELTDLAEHIDPSDVDLLQWAGVPEPEDERRAFFAKRARERAILTDVPRSDEVTGADVLAEIRKVTDLPAFVDQTGGGCATVQIGDRDAEGRYRWCIGPGRFDWDRPDDSTFYTGDLYVGPDDEGETEPFEIHDLAALGPALARMIHDADHETIRPDCALCESYVEETIR